MIRAVVTDIEGTTSSIAFVKDVLFPYAQARMGSFLAEHHDDPEVAKLLEDVASEVGHSLSLTDAITQLKRWIDEDRKITPLKALQGLIWEEGYRRRDFHGHIYPDAAEQLRSWHERGIALYVYSSGSVHAQKLLYGYTEYGDLTPLFSGYFDTRIGHKKEAASYRHMVAELGVPAAEILFLSDVAEELDAAREAGMQTGWLVRDSIPDAAARHPQYADFSAIRLD